MPKKETSCQTRSSRNTSSMTRVFLSGPVAGYNLIHLPENGECFCWWFRMTTTDWVSTRSSSIKISLPETHNGTSPPPPLRTLSSWVTGTFWFTVNNDNWCTHSQAVAVKVKVRAVENGDPLENCGLWGWLEVVHWFWRDLWNANKFDFLKMILINLAFTQYKIFNEISKSSRCAIRATLLWKRFDFTVRCYAVFLFEMKPLCHCIQMGQITGRILKI